ncbi:MAG: protein arginine kinase [Bacillota bacterium]
MSQVEYNTSRWMEGGGPESDIAVSSRVRAARNLEGHPFSCLASEQENYETLEKIIKGIIDKEEFAGFKYLAIRDIASFEKQALVEKHLISPFLAYESNYGALMISEDEAVGVMINEEDHLRIQTILPGLQLEEAWQDTGRYDDFLESEFDYVFDENYGYLTACPTNVGTGLRASVMLHLPALIMTRQINRILGALSQVGLAVRGLYGEGTEIIGNLVQVSNQVTLGQSEEEIIGNLASVISQVIEQEQNARQDLLNKKRADLSDKAWRALGTLEYAQVISSQEAIQVISDLRLGYDLGLINGINHKLLNELLVLIRPGCLQLLAGRELGHNERSLERPVFIKETLKRSREQNN